MSSPLVSVIVPAYNAAAHIGEALASVFAQSLPDYEVIVVNDGSPDTVALEEVLGPYRDRIVYLHQANAGPSAARNAGIRVARGRYLAFLDSDDAWLPEYLAVQVGALEADRSADVVYPNALICGDHPHAGRTYMDVCPSEGEVTLERLVAQQCQVFTGATARRETIVRVGMYDPEVGSSEDFDLWLRILASDGRIIYHRRVLVRFRKHRGSLSSDPVWMMGHAIRVLEKAARTLPLSPRERAVVERQRELFRANLNVKLARRALARGDGRVAARHLAAANAVLRRPKLTVARWLVRVAPQVLVLAYGLRHGRVLGADANF